MANMPTLFDFVQPGKRYTEKDKYELEQMIRIAAISEMEARYIYEAFAQAVDIPLWKSQLLDISREEGAHIGELAALGATIGSDAHKQIISGIKEVRESMENLGLSLDKLKGFGQ